MGRIRRWAAVWIVAAVAGLVTLTTLLARVPNASLPEATWTALAVGGVLLHLIGLRDAIDDLLALAASARPGPIDPVLLALERAKVRSEVLRMLVKSIFAAVGLWSLVTPSPATPRVAEWADFAAWAFLGALALLTADSLLARSDQTRILDELKRRLGG